MSGQTSHRDVPIDLARGLAVLLMIQTHSFDGWTTDDDRLSLGYRITRELGASVAPSFLLLAGVGIGMMEKKLGRAARWPLFIRGATILLAGYAVSLAYGLIEWSFDLPTLLRADILHAIGLSLTAAAILFVGRSRGVLLALGSALLSVLFQPLLGLLRVRSSATGISPLLGLFVDVQPFTRFPFFPLFAFVCVGYLVAKTKALATPLFRNYSSTLAWIALAGAFSWLTRDAVSYSGGSLSRQHPAVVFNVLDGCARALAVVAIAHPLAKIANAARILPVVGRHSLFLYALHIPLCYGRLARPWSHRLAFGTALGLTLLLMCVMTLVAFGLERRSRMRASTQD